MITGKKDSGKKGHIGKDDFNRTIELLFVFLDHRESSLRILADQCLDSIFRQLQIGMHYSRVIASLLAILTKNLSARGVVSALNKLSMTIQFSQAKRANLYGFHYLNALCLAMKRPEESIQTAIEKTSPVIFEFLGPFLVDVNIEKAEELYNIAISNFDLSGAANRAACMVASQLAIFVPPILHKTFYKISSIISELDDVEHRNRLVASLITFRLIWKTIIVNSNDFSIRAIQRLLCKILCCLYSSTNEILVSSIETLEYIFQNPSKVFDFAPLMVQNSSSSATNSPEKQPYDNRFQKTPRKMGSIDDLSDDELSSFVASPWGSVDEMSINNSKANSTVVSDEDQRTLNDFDVDTEANENSIADPLLNSEMYDEETQRTRSEPSLHPSETDHARIPDNLPEDICDLATNFYHYTALLIASRFLIDSFDGLKDDQKVRVSHKILALNCLSAVASRSPDIVSISVSKTNQQTIITAYNFVSHDDDGVSIAAFNFFMNVEQTMNLLEKPRNSSKILSMITKVFEIRNPIRLKGALQSLANSIDVIVADDNVLMKTFDYCLSTCQIDYFLLKITRAEFVSRIPWSRVSAHCREKYQQKWLDALLSQLFDSDNRVVKATSVAISSMISNAEFGRLTKIFLHSLPDIYLGSAFERIPIVLGFLPEYSFNNNSIDFVTAQNLSHVLECVFSLLIENFHDRQSGIISCLTKLCEDFSPNLYRNCVFEELIFRSQEEENLKLEDLLKLSTNNFVEKLIVVYLRIINLYYTILAEEKSKNYVASTSVLSRPNLIPPSSPRMGERSRAESLSNLIGTGIHTTRPTSYLNSPVLLQLEHNLRGSFQNYMGSLDIELQNRFSEVLEVALRGLCVLLEVIPFEVCKSFLDEILLYCNNLFNIALNSCTQLIHQLLKTIFYKNLININVATIQSTILRNQILPRETNLAYTITR
uniref:Huntingtin n=1 Tax=Acrobeloides nanus TaxID=290746 RepID=A0A914EL52_9BILA